MNHVTAPIYCPICQTLNTEAYNFCQQCRSSLPKRYLWAVGAGVDAYQIGDVLGDRYVLKSRRVLFDTKPGLLPDLPSDISDAIAPYLRLFPYQLHIPQVYGQVQTEKGAPVVLLEQVPLETRRWSQSAAELSHPLFPALADVWPEAPAIRQLNWLWQISQLWQPFSSERVATSLVEPQLLRVEGPLVRLLELQSDRKSAPTLRELGQLWLQWAPTAQPEIARFLAALCHQMIQGQIRTPEQLTAQLDRGLVVCGRSQARLAQIATRTDQGPSRQRNEDACYPASGTTFSVPLHPGETPKTLTLVCDGIGGHEGGDVASNLAIAAVQERIQALELDVALQHPDSLMAELEQAVCLANDLICQRNDQERRLERQRMGTTLVMALARGHEAYITHIGDSRVYWITRTGCYQLTVDDDVASREVRLGYALYRDAVQQPVAGSLVQALGMSSSATLHPTVQRLILDEAGVFLLCSDGLTENDRVEECWETEILPILDGKVDVATACQRLVEIGNMRNGHDNVTVGLLYYQVTHTEAIAELPASLLTESPDLDLLPTRQPTAIVTDTPTQVLNAAPSTLKTQILPPRRSPNGALLLLGILLLVGLGGVLAYLLLPGVSRRIDPLLGRAPQPDGAQVNPGTPISTLPSPNPSPLVSSLTLAPGTLIQIRQPTSGLASDRETGSIQLQPQPGSSTTAPAPESGVASSLASGDRTPKAATAQLVPAGGLLQVLSKQVIPAQGSWVKLKVCSIPSGTNAQESPSPRTTTPTPTASPSNRAATPSLSDRFLQPGASGWIEEAVLMPLIEPDSPSPNQLGACSNPPLTPTPTPTTAPSQSPAPE
ncbi:protein phosphatase 2C domain-containing protein [Trichocoleus sp. FACHB-591]|uniref:protein phosphatase 2C domain-containing protein n=1 Tax=Trichocoleus sp. FACHB-591 TaxID=2692872 RepID=UPI001685D537|nr:protein phosphatase 2C domain-containing protein [Trichocoleus sp. FACHB-591]MBD2098950.1 protein phosphatase 2C domain-containing protein [Trichocoleus sp. FACHB-591]